MSRANWNCRVSAMPSIFNVSAADFASKPRGNRQCSLFMNGKRASSASIPQRRIR